MVKSLLMILVSITLAVVGQLLLKSGMNRIGPISGADIKNISGIALAIVTNVQVIGGLAFYGLSAVVWLVVLSRVNLSFAYPLLGLSYVLVMLASTVLFHETVAPLRWAGAICIVFGVILISRT